jgi:AcrR family transcriptional regulator
MAKAAHRLQSDEETDLKILKAAAKLFREQGFDATTVRQIAKAAQMLPGSLHYRYQSKDEVLVALMRRGTSKAMEAVREAVKAEPDAIERLRLALRAHLRLLIHGDDALYVLLFDWRALPPRSRAGIERERAKYEAFWDELIAEAAMTGRARPQIDLGLARRFSFGAINWVATWHHEVDQSAEQIADAYFTYVAYGLLTDQGRPKDIEERFEALSNPKSPERK